MRKIELKIGSKIFCHHDGFINGLNGEQFCTKGKFYKIINFEDNHTYPEYHRYAISDDRGLRHEFVIQELVEGKCRWFSKRLIIVEIKTLFTVK